MIKRKSLKVSCGQEWPDIVQEAKLRCLSVLDKDFYQAYLFRTINNLALNYLKKKERMSSVFSDPNQDLMDNLDELHYAIDFGAKHDISKFMRSHWNQKERDAIFAFFTNKATVRDCSDTLDVTPTTAQRWLSKVKRLFKEELGEYATS